MTTPTIDYTARDFSTIKEALRTHIQAKFPDTWKDFYESQMGVAWLELVAYCFDVLSFYLDYQANESFLPTARDRLSVVNICKLIGYKLRPATSAAVTVTGTIAAVEATDVVIPQGTQVTTSTGVVFRTAAEQRITAGNLSSGLVFSEGERHADSFVSDGARFQRFQLSDPDVINGSIEVTVAGTDWTEVASLVYADATATSFAVWYDENSYGYIEFGDGTSGGIPPVGSAIAVEYRCGGGVQGNIALRQISTTILGERAGILPVQNVTVSVVNDEERGSGGEERETIEHAKYWAPRWVSTNGRAVTEHDFDTLAILFNDSVYGAPAFAKAKLRQEIPELNTVDLYVWSRDSEGAIALPSTGLKQALEDYFMNNGEGAVRVICTDLEAQDGEIVTIDVAVTLRPLLAYAAAEVISRVTANLSAMFSSASITPGAAFRLSQIYDAIQDTEGVDSALVDLVTASQQTTEAIGVGTGATTNFVDTVGLEPGLSIVAATISITAGALTVTDDGSGNLIGDVNVAGTNSVNYTTGAIDVTFSSSPTAGVIVYCQYRHIIDYQRGGTEFTATGVVLTTGSLRYPPIVPYDVLTGTKGVAFTDGAQIVRDMLGDGNLYVGVLLVGTIDYDTGSYRITWPVVPASGTSIYTTYRQRLQTPSEDIPIDNSQLAVKGILTVVTTASG